MKEGRTMKEGKRKEGKKEKKEGRTFAPLEAGGGKGRKGGRKE